jgi:hypothetical protein
MLGTISVLVTHVGKSERIKRLRVVVNPIIEVSSLGGDGDKCPFRQHRAI